MSVHYVKLFIGCSVLGPKVIPPPPPKMVFFSVALYFKETWFPFPLLSSARFFSSGCAPGAEPSSPFCTQCVGSGEAVGDESKCKASSEERYYGYAGALK